MKWETIFESQIQIENIITRENLTNSIDEKIEQFTLSNEDTQYLELTETEVGDLFFNLLDQYSTENIFINKIYIDSQKNSWEICTEVNIKKINMSPWICIDLNKDNIQSPQLYITELNIGPYSIKQFNIVEKINQGISNSILTVNENGFSGRYIENISLLENKLVVKGSVY